jgi:hypothetical protein
VAGRDKRRGGKKRGRQAGKEFMDAAMDGYIRDLALRCWREFEDLSEAHGDPDRALGEVGTFTGAGSYRPLWVEAWRRHVWPAPQGPAAPLFGRIEAAVREALLAERAARAEHGEPTIEDTPDYQEFVARALNVLYQEASGEIEELD